MLTMAEFRDPARMLTFQDFEQAQDKPGFVLEAIKHHVASKAYRIACDADLYDRQMNKTINAFVKKIYNLSGCKFPDSTASNNKIACNFFHRLNTQRNMYSLGAGVSFTDAQGNPASEIDEKLGRHFDHDLQYAAYLALIHGVSFGFWNLDRLFVFPFTQFCPFWDEYDGTLKAGARFWRLDNSRPLQVVLYEEDGYTRFSTDGPADTVMQEAEPKRSYITTVRKAPADEYPEVIGEENYSSLPIVPLWGSKLHQSTLVGMREAIDSYDLIRSGFANDLEDCAEIFWLVENAGGMTESDLDRFRDRVKLMHIASVDSDAGEKVTPYAQEVPHAARKEYLDLIRAGIYEDFGALDVHTVAAGATNDHIDAAYQPMDEEAADFEYQVSEFVQQVLALQDIEAVPVFKRTRISNQSEQVSMVVQEAQWLDHETILRKLPNISPDEVDDILDRIQAEEQERMGIAESIASGKMGGAPVEEEVTVEEEEEV